MAIDIFPSKLTIWVYRIWTYMILPILLCTSIYLIFFVTSSNQFDIGFLWFPAICLLQMVGLHLKSKFAYWTNFLFIFIAIFVVSLVKDSIRISLVRSILDAGFLGAIYGIIVCFLIYSWYKVKILFYPIRLEDVDWNFRGKLDKTSSIMDYLKEMPTPTKVIWGIIILFGIKLGQVFYDEHQKRETVSTPKPAVSVTQTPVVSQPPINNTAIQNPEIQNDVAFHNEVQRQIPDLFALLNNPDFVVFLNTKVIDYKGTRAMSLVQFTGQNKDISNLPRIRSLIDEYQRNKMKPQIDPSIAFSCSLNNGLDIFVTKRGNDYAYTAWNINKNTIDLDFVNTPQQITNNSLLHRNGATLVMQNGAYQYRIAKQGNQTTIFVYNGDKGISSHYCKSGTLIWDTQKLPTLYANLGSTSHKRYCKQIINEIIYLKKISSVCPIESGQININAEDMMAFFSAEGCNYLLNESIQSQQGLVASLSDKLNKSIDKKIGKLGGQFCIKESAYANKMVERYKIFLNLR